MICGHTFDFARAQMSESKRAGGRLYIRTGVRYMAVRGDDDQWPVRAINNCIFINQLQRQPQISRLEFEASKVLQSFLLLLNMNCQITSNIDIASCYQRESWPWKTLGLEITGSGTGWRSEQHFKGGRYEQRLDYKFVKEKRGLQQNKRGWICIEDEAISWAGLKPEKVELRANLKLPILPDEALWESKCSLGNYKFEWSLKRTHHIVESAQVVSESSKVVPGQKSCWRHIWVQI